MAKVPYLLKKHFGDSRITMLSFNLEYVFSQLDSLNCHAKISQVIMDIILLCVGFQILNQILTEP